MQRQESTTTCGVDHGRPDLDRLEGLYRKYAPLISARARLIIGSDADDVVHEVFLKMLTNPPEDREILAWMYKTSTNLCIDRLRYVQRRRTDWQAQVATTYDLAYEDFSSRLENQELCRRLLHRFDQKTQALVVLVYFDEMTTTRAAEMLGISRKWATVRLKKFRENAKKILSRWAAEAAYTDGDRDVAVLALARD